jgi:hypothetical protein
MLTWPYHTLTTAPAAPALHRGELGLTRSQMELMRRELNTTKQQLQGAQKQLERATFEARSQRDQGLDEGYYEYE